MKSIFHPCGSPLSFKAAFFMVAMLTALTPAHAVTWGFQNITNNSGIASAVGGQLTVDVESVGTTGASFTFSNSGPVASSITDIYFVNDPLLFGGTNIVNGTGVSFSAGATPPGLPGGAPFGFDASATVFSADSDSPVQPNGVNPGESVTIILSLLGGVDFGDVINAVLGGTLRLGLHVQGIDGSDSDSYITAATPLPGAIPLFATGLAALGLLRWRAKRKSIAQ
jgi:hypothetical protein